MQADLTHERIGENQSRFREANEQIELAAQQLPHIEPVPFLCECPRLACTTLIPLTLSEYEEIRQAPARFFTAPGHEDSSVEAGAARIVGEQDGYRVVEKVREAGEIAVRRYRELS